ncbi:MAG: undecaprenyl-diphosphate phosphatase [Cytophagales bacterium]|nr:undecaprenyl-diphosphate phosphatase [Cytophagales bacterium]
MSWIEALILGIVQGLTEFLPVSSSGHLEIGSVLLGLKSSNNLLFAVVVHLATAMSTIVVYRKDIGQLSLGLLSFQANESWNYMLKILLSMIPVAVIGLLWQNEIEAFFSGNLFLVGCMLLITAILLIVSHYYGKQSGEFTFFKAFIVGIAQAVAVLPGISRSGATISTALILGVEREKAARFSFLMVLIPIIGAATLKLKDYFESPLTDAISGFSLVIGFLAAFLSGYFACQLMVRLVTKGRLIFFAVYCAIAGAIAIISQLL